MRVLIPGRYGEENPKWLTRIELTDHFVGGLYSDQGWYNGPLHTMSRIDHPTDSTPLGRTIEIGGIAFAGNRGIQKVEVSTDGGLTWHVASLQPPCRKIHGSSGHGNGHPPSAAPIHLPVAQPTAQARYRLAISRARSLMAARAIITRPSRSCNSTRLQLNLGPR